MNISILDVDNDIWTIEVDDVVFGSAQIIELEITQTDSLEEIYTFELRDFYALDVVRDVPFNEAHESGTQTVDPGKVLIWILKKIKKALCPECV